MKNVQVSSAVFCDKCGIQVKTTVFDAFDFDFELRTGEQFPESGTGDKYTLDLCPACADDIVKDLKHNGYNIQESEWDN